MITFYPYFMVTLFATHLSVLCILFFLANAAGGGTVPFEGAEVGDRIGARYIGGSRDTAYASFWVSTPVGGKDPFAGVSASLWYMGGWGGLESRVASSIFRDHCGGTGNLILDVGSHVGYFTLLALAHGCRTTTVELNPRFIELLRLSIALNGFDAGNSTIVHGYVGKISPTIKNAGNVIGLNSFLAPAARSAPVAAVTPDTALQVHSDKQVIYTKLDVEGSEGVALGEASLLLNTTRFLYLELTLVVKEEFRAARRTGGAEAGCNVLDIICSRESNTVRSLRALQRSSLDLYRIVDAVSGGGFARNGRLKPMPFQPAPREVTMTAEELTCRQIAREQSCTGGDPGSDLSPEGVLYCCWRNAEACQIDIFGAQPPFKFPEDAFASLPDSAAAAVATTTLSAGTRPKAGSNGVEITPLPAESVTWRHPPRKQMTSGGNHAIQFGTQVKFRDWSRGIGGFHVSLPATLEAADLASVHVCPQLELDLDACEELVEAVAKAALS